MKPVDGLVGAKTKQVLISKSKYYREYVMEQIQKGNTFTHYGNVPLENQTKPRAGAQKPAGTNKPAQKPQNNTGGQSNQKQNTTAANMPGGFSNNDINLLAQAVYGEARGEPFEGQVAIAAVILNRIKSPLFPNTVAGVIFEPLAFTAVADGQIYMQPNERAKEAVLDAINGWDLLKTRFIISILIRRQANGFGDVRRLKESESTFSVSKSTQNEVLT